uniref:RING-type domain-containing protein n=1 Tax=viral metagenome TaxID=1070528 RepID=A0A6C0HFG5_9ZZZZ
MNNYQNHYNIQFLDDLHNYFPALLYDQRQFGSVQDVFIYMNHQIDYFTNPYRRGYAEYIRTHPSAPIARTTTTTTTNTTNTTNTTTFNTQPRIIPIYSQTMNSMPSTPGTSFLSEYLINMLQIPITASTTNPNLEPVIVRPTILQIDSATTLRSAMAIDEEQVCSICQENYTEGQAIRTITHCDHKFHKNCIDTWLGRNVHCPVCRHDIRE